MGEQCFRGILFTGKAVAEPSVRDAAVGPRRRKAAQQSNPSEAVLPSDDPGGIGSSPGRVTRRQRQHMESGQVPDSQASTAFAKVPPVKKAGAEDETVTENEDIAREFRQAFFPAPPPCEPEDAPSTYSQLPWEPITKHEVKAAVSRASPDKAPGRDGLPARVWRELWLVLEDEITLLFTKSLETGKVPREWNMAKIVPLQKPKRKVDTVANNYRPISLLPALGKALESVVAERIAYLVEEYNLLSKAHFGARKQRSTTHALSFLCEDVFRPWRGKKTLSLVSFDVKDAYSNVATELTNAEAAILTQLRTGKIFLKGCPHRIEAAEAVTRWAQARARMRQEHGQRFGELSYALGGYSSRQEGDESVDGPMEQWKPDMSAVRVTIEFAKGTGRLQSHEQGTASLEEETNERRALRIPYPLV
ncbi:hypothetical protein DL765_006313 [Monosporascus sp. GIB2]|nr:hypothetical protein DL765_006313 [Monosporascus sp. GIB2]